MIISKMCSLRLVTNLLLTFRCEKSCLMCIFIKKTEHSHNNKEQCIRSKEIHGQISSGLPIKAHLQLTLADSTENASQTEERA